MRHLGWAALVLAGCAAEAPAPVEADRNLQEASCAAAVAAHVGKGPGAVAALWSGETPTGNGIVTVSDDGGAGSERVHSCEVDAGGHVLAIRHVGE